MRALFVIMAVLLLVPDWTGEARLPLLGPRAAIRATRVTLDPGDVQRTRAGRLTFLGGVTLTSDDPAFGGFSSLAVVGERFTLLSDGGNVIRFRMGGDWTPRTTWSGYLPGGPGAGWDKADRDSESMTSDGARVWVGFEGANAVWRYDAAFLRAQGMVKPSAMTRWPDNGGAEAMVRLRDGRFVVLRETRGSDRFRAVDKVVRRRLREGLIFAGDPLEHPMPQRFTYVAPTGFDVSDAAELPDGGLLVLNRRFRLPYRFISTITRVSAHDVASGGLARAEPIATLDAPLIHDNFEGIAATRDGLATIVWIVSDDNESILQRTLLLKFRLER